MSTLALHSNETRGMLLGLVGVAMFAMTLPMTRLAVAALDPVWLAFARAEGAALLAAIALLATRSKRPERRHWPALAATAWRRASRAALMPSRSCAVLSIDRATWPTSAVAWRMVSTTSSTPRVVSTNFWVEC
jgi:hypothetical protein